MKVGISAGGNGPPPAFFHGERAFMYTWGAYISDASLRTLLAYQRNQGRLTNLIAVRLPTRCCHLLYHSNKVS